ncbi:MAG TPA: hypothetical protein PKE63_14190 [Lacibacter sp.]|nr:hypothetical protein [Lacibacter sp.]
MKLLLTLLCCGVLLATTAQTIRQPLVSTYPAMGAYSRNKVDAFSFIINPAALANLKQAGAGVYAERRFLLSALTQYTAAAGMTTSSGNFGLQADYFGSTNYNETQLGLGYARSLGSKVDVGVKFNYYNLRIPAYLTASTFHFEAGVVMHLSEQMHAAFSVYNPVGGVINKTADEKIASVYRGGLGYEVSDRFFIMAEVIKEERKNVGLNAGFEYTVARQLLLRGGVNTVTAQPFFGAGLRMGTLRVDLASYWHPQLGVTPALMLLFDFKKPSDAE